MDLDMIYGENKEELERRNTYPDGKTTRLQCCKNLKTDALVNTLNGTWPRFRLNHDTGKYMVDQNTESII